MQVVGSVEQPGLSRSPCFFIVFFAKLVMAASIPMFSGIVRLCPLLFCFALLVGACVPRSVSVPATLSAEDTESMLSTGKQCLISPTIAEVARKVRSDDTYQTLQNAMRYIGENFVYDSWNNNEQFNQTAAALFEKKILGGCSDYALVELALFRSLGIPARLVLTVNVDWIERYRRDGISIPVGHTFIEVVVNREWLLVDPPFFNIYRGYDPKKTWYPNRQMFLARALDFWSIGLRNMEECFSLYLKAARFDTSSYLAPQYPEMLTIEFDLPLMFTNAGDLFCREGRYPLARREYGKALSHNSSYVPAYMNRGRMHLELDNFAEAEADFGSAIQYSPDQDAAYVFRGRTYGRLGEREKMCADFDRACALGNCEEKQSAMAADLCAQ